MRRVLHGDVRAAARALLAVAPEARDGLLLRLFAEAKVPSTPYALSVDPSGDSTRALIDGDPVPQGSGAEIMTDGDWVSLQGICGG